MSFQPTTAQKLAIEITDKSLVLAAGAGSGKTRVLVQRYLHLLTQRLAGVGEILALTFTNKAAGEMKERILKEVFRQAQIASTTEEKEFWRQIREDLTHAQITTFHGFCGQILRQHPLQGKVDPYFTILDERDASELLDQTVEEVFLHGLEDDDPAMVALTREFSIYRIDRLLKSAYLHSQSMYTSVDTLTEKTVLLLQESIGWLEELKKELTQLIEGLINSDRSDLAAGTKKKLDKLEKVWPKMKGPILEITSLEALARQYFSQLREILKGNVAKAVKEDIKRIREIIEKEMDIYLADLRALDLVSYLGQVLEQIDQNYQKKKWAQGGLDFNDLESLTLRLLKKNPEFINSFQDTFRFIMVDEFQDTNPVQEELIRLLIGGSETAPIQGNKLFIVGDPKQSIYRFRGADVTVFQNLQQEIRSMGQEIVMDLNFRSRKKVIDFVNDFFQRVFGSENNPYDMEYQPSTAHRVYSGEEPCIELMVVDQDEITNEDLGSRHLEAQRLAKRIQHMVLAEEKLVYGNESCRPVQYGDICLLFQAMTQVQIYEAALQELQIPYTVVNGQGYFEQQEIRDLLNLLKIIENSQQELEWVGVLRSPLCGLSDEDIYFLVTQKEPIRELLAQIGDIDGLSSIARERLGRFRTIYLQARKLRERWEISAYLSWLLEETGYQKLALVHPQGKLLRANLDKLIALAQTYETKPLASLAGFIRHLEDMETRGIREGLADVAGEHNRVQLMSVHQSKGLEFPVVFLPDCQRTLVHASQFPPIFFDSEIGLGLKVRDPLQGGLIPTSIHKQICAEEERREIAERKRLFYVAVTRARDYLLLSGTGRKFKANTIEEGSSWLDWLAMAYGITEAAQLPESLRYGPEQEHEMIVTSVEQIRYGEQPAIESVPLDLQSWEKSYTQAQKSPRVEFQDYQTFGVSSLLTYQRCPRWYYHQFIQKMPLNINSPGDCFELVHPLSANNEKKMDPLERGTLVHYVCQYIKEPDELTELISTWVKEQDISKKITIGNIDQLVREIKPYIDPFIQKENSLKNEFGSENVTEKREFPFELILGKTIIRGTIDRLLVRSKKGLIIDYKTASLPNHGEFNYQLQAELYALAVHQLFGLSEVEVKFLYLKSDDCYQLKFQQGDFPEITTKTRQLIRSIITAQEQGMMTSMSKEFPLAYKPHQCPYRDHHCWYLRLCQKE